jgi:hypothetical protein
MTLLRRPLLGLVLLGALVACDRPAPTAAFETLPTTQALLGPDESWKTLEEYYDAAGNYVTVEEWGAGALPAGGTVASVVIKRVVPVYAGTGDSSDGYCITSTIVRVETTPGWSYSIKKSGGCNKEIVVELSNKTTDQKATFQYLYIPGKTRIDVGFVR